MKYKGVCYIIKITDFEVYAMLVSLGVRKNIIATASFDALAKKAKEYTSTADKPNYFTLSSCMADAVCENVKRHIGIFLNK